MKYITLIIGLLVMGCCTPVKELTLREKVVGTYEFKEDGDTYRTVLLENGVMEAYENGKKRAEGRWTGIHARGVIARGRAREINPAEIHVEVKDGHITVYRINKDGSITGIARTYKDGKREDIPKVEQLTYKKIK